MKYFVTTMLFFCMSISLHAAKLDGKWSSSTSNIIYLDEEKGGFRIQVVLKSGATYTWQAKWLDKRKSFWYKTRIGRYTGSVENLNTIIVSGMTDMVDKKGKKFKVKEIYIWRRVNKVKAKKHKKSSRSKKRRLKYPNYRYYYPYPQYLEPPRRIRFRPEPEYTYDYAYVGWEYKKGTKVKYLQCVSKNKISASYGGVDNHGLWLALIIPVISIEQGNWGISVIFVRSNGRWVLRYMRPMRIVLNRRGFVDWKDVVNHSIPLTPGDNWSLKQKDGMFYFEYHGNIPLGPNRWVRKIKVKGKLRSLTE